jgi:ABC-2 type transport system ATP-binding protein
MKALEVKNISKKLKGAVLLDDVSFSVDEGEIVSLIGPNGAGKSTAMKIISHLVFPDSGNISVCGYDLATDTVEALSNLSAMIEAPALYSQFTGRQHLEMTASLRNKSKKEVEKYVRFCNIGSEIDSRVTKYSLGMKQRLYLSMSLLADPKLLILDEPTNGLDFTGVFEFREQTKSLAQKGTAVLLSSHILSDLSKISDRFIFIKDGRILNEVNNDSKLDVESLYIKYFGDSENKG